jgi:hypothetical protein
VNTPDSRDRSLDQLLRQSSGPASVSDQCVDGETLAAWVEGSLPTHPAMTVERHLADCARCQALLAAFVRSEPLVSAAPARATPWWHLRWIVPFATAATAIAVWVLVPSPAARRQEPPAVADQKVAAAESYPPPSNMTALSPPGALAESKPPVMHAPAPAQGRQANQAGGRQVERETDSLAKSKASPDSVPKAKEEAALRADPSERARVGSAAATSKPLAPSEQKPPTVPERTASARSRDERATELRDAPPAAPPPLAMARQESVGLTVELISPDTTQRWRIVGGSRVERSIDGGVSWQPALTSTQGLIVNGHAASPSVAWIVGRGGSVFVTTNGRRFDQVPFPEKVDLVSVVAVDDRQATVTTADGRRFATLDRGVTWERR